MRSRTIVALAVAGTAWCALAGCAGSGEVVTAAGLTILVGEKSGDAADALLAGRLANVSGCLGVDDTVVVWPHGTKLSREDPLTVSIPGVGRVRIGDEVSIGGGVVLNASPAGQTTGDVQIAGVNVPARCTTRNVWVGG